MPNLAPELLWELADMPHAPLPLTGDLLPPLPGIYIVYQHEQVLYVGQTMCLNQRWNTHHRRKDFSHYPTPWLAWHVLPRATLTDVRQKERLLITTLQPILNRQPGPHSASMQHPIKVARDLQRLSLTTLAKQTRIDVATLSRLERCERRLTTRHLRVLAQALGCTEQDLIPTEADEQTIRQTGLACPTRTAGEVRSALLPV